MKRLISALRAADDAPATAAGALPFTVSERPHGYVIAAQDGPRTGLKIMQVSATMIGGMFLSAALGMLMVPHLGLGAADFAFRAGAAVVFAAISAYLLWFASRGTRVELEIDTRAGQINEVVCNKAGRRTVLQSFPFSDIGGAFLHRRAQEAGTAMLVLRYRNTPRYIYVAEAAPQALSPLKDRLGRDVMGLSAAAEAASARATVTLFRKKAARAA